MGEKCLKNRGDYVFDTLKREILRLELKPGQAISENEICARFEVSRTPVREALRRLQEQGFVRTVPYSGTYVTLLNLDDIRQMIYMRIAVELMVMKDFMQIATPLLLEEVRHHIRCQELLIQQENFEPEDFYAMDDQMHKVWFSATGRLKLWTVIQAQQLHYTRFRMLDFVTETDFTRIIREHAGFLEMLENHDEKGLEDALKKHLSISMTRMKHAIEVEYRDYFEPDSVNL
ncbi:GntR family transcriptional regulator [Brotaphodocola sp.]|uniref:GntR family transcriptional regulator n=1 Tax=Brotaphodocola sp. TaxID=3073577 RepID=UPI003D7EC253